MPNPSELVDLILSGGEVALPYLDGQPCQVFAMDDPEIAKQAAPALARFLEKSRADRIADSRHVHAYYEDFRAAVGGEDWMDDDFGRVTDPTKIWDLVKPVILAVETWTLDTPLKAAFVVLEANCAWEDEHGLMMSWKNGEHLTKVSGYDGDPLNGDPDKPDDLHHAYIYFGNPSHATRRA